MEGVEDEAKRDQEVHNSSSHSSSSCLPVSCMQAQRSSLAALIDLLPPTDILTKNIDTTCTIVTIYYIWSRIANGTLI